MHYRIAVNSDGSVHNFAEVEGSFKDGKRIFYIEANSKEEALKILASKWDKQRAKAKAAALERAIRAKTDGRCATCPGVARNGMRRCQACRTRAAVHERDSRNRAAGMPVPRIHTKAAVTDEEKAAAVLRAKERQRTYKYKHVAGVHVAVPSSKIRALRPVLAQFDARTPAGFRRWLVNEIKRLEGEQKAAGERAVARRQASPQPAAQPSAA